MTPFQIEQIVKTFHLVESGGVARWAARQGDRLEGSWAANPVELVSFAEAYKDWNFYVQPNPSTKRHGKRCTAEDIADWRWFLIDLDPNEESPPDKNDFDTAIWEVKAAVQAYMGKRYFPVVINSGRGRQLWFRVSRDGVGLYQTNNLMGKFNLTRVGVDGEEVVDIIPMRSAVQDAQRYWLKQLAGRITVPNVVLDPCTSDLPRLMRCPGTINTKTENIARFESLDYDEEIHFCAGLAGKLLRYTPVTEFRRSHSCLAPLGFAVGQPWQAAVPFLSGRGADYLTFGALEPGRHSGAVAAARSLAEQGIEEKEIFRALLFGGSLCRPELNDATYFDRTAKDACRRVAYS